MSVEEFIRALNRYAHLLGFPVNVEWARTVESVQQEIMGEVRGAAGGYKSLREFIEALDSQGLLEKAIAKASSAMGEDVEEYRRSVEAALIGDLNVKGSKPALIALQAIARAYAEEASKKGLLIEQSAYCPICGATSETMVKAGNRYLMVCHFCTYTWIVSEKHPTCPYCGNTDMLTIGVISDKHMRIALMKCWKCGSTWRAILDETIKAPPALLPLIAMAAERYSPILATLQKE
ncbi:MAG: formate dehydrogenase accessory protein FdhE [Thermoprotei archaeon]|nr:formate dehydrogenase accessory protein FdhE [Thermoprotei archaeon]